MLACGLPFNEAQFQEGIGVIQRKVYIQKSPFDQIIKRALAFRVIGKNVLLASSPNHA